MPVIPSLDQIVDRAGRDAVDVGLLDHRSECLLGHPARLQEAGEIAALAQLRDPQFDGAGPGLPVAVAIAVALRQPLRRLLAIAGAGQAADLQLHQPLGGEADHLAQQIGVGGLLHERAQVHHVVGHRWFLGCVGVSQPDPTGKSSMTAARSLRRYGGRARERLSYRPATPLGGARPATMTEVLDSVRSRP